MPQPIDYPTNIRFALEDRVATMDDNDTVLDRGVVYVDSGTIAEVKPEGAPSPTIGTSSSALADSRTCPILSRPVSRISIEKGVRYTGEAVASADTSSRFASSGDRFAAKYAHDWS